MFIGKRDFKIGKHTYIMGIINATPDSFSDGGRFPELKTQLHRVETMISEGADIIDIGGESTRPGFRPVDAEEEAARIVPLIKEVKRLFDVPVSADTYKAEVARAALDAGCDMINDIRGLAGSPDMGQLVAESGACCCLMHSIDRAGDPDFLHKCIADLNSIADQAVSAGIGKDKIILDPGVGFGKKYEDNLSVLKHLEEFRQLGYPMLLGTSRKSVIGLTLDLPVDERLEGTLATTALAVMAGWSFVRVHDIKENKRTIQMIEAVLNTL
jgi:dihydropteroate synthase